MSELQPPCPCGSPRYDACCAPLHLGTREAATAEELMRARYSAYALNLAPYVWRTWHPRTRPADVGTAGIRWTGLTITETEAGGPQDATGVVAFVARHTGGELRERSRFERRAGRWFYVDGDVEDSDG